MIASLEVTYISTNESLDAIMEGLDIKSKDRVLSIMGSGDQALAMLEKADFVDAVDSDDFQFHYFRDCIELLDCEKYEEFLSLKSVNSYGYFKSGERLEKISQRLGRLDIFNNNIFKMTDKYDKIYLSNAVGFVGDEEAWEIKGIFEMMDFYLNEGGLIYVANHRDLMSYGDFLPESLVIDKESSVLAHSIEKNKNRYEDWRPAVYRKV